MEKLAERFISCHNNPVIKTELFGSKLFLTPLNKEEHHNQEKCLKTIENVLKHFRVDRRCNRSIVKWLPETRLANVTKIVGSLIADWGTQNKNGKYLTPEETLHLLEINKIELLYNNVPLTVQEAYRLVLNDLYFTSKKSFFIYKKLLLQQYKLKTVKPSVGPSACKKIKIECIDTENHCSDSEINKIKTCSETSNDLIVDCFKKLKQRGAVVHSQTSRDSYISPDYLISGSIDKHKSLQNLVIKSGNTEFSSTDIAEDHSYIYAFSFDDSVTLCKCFVANVFPT